MSLNSEAIRWAYAHGYRVDDAGNFFAPTGRQRKLKLRHVRGLRYYQANVKPPGVSARPIDIHRFAAYQWFGEETFADGIQVRHLNSNSEDNARSNLALGTASDNALDKSPEVRRRTALKAAHAKSKLTLEQVREVVLLSAQGLKGKQIADHFGVLQSTVCEILQGKLYSDVTGLTPVSRAPKRTQEAA